MFIRTQIPSGRGSFAKQRGESGGIRATTPEKDSRRHRTLFSFSFGSPKVSSKSVDLCGGNFLSNSQKTAIFASPQKKKDLACDLIHHILLLLLS